MALHDPGTTLEGDPSQIRSEADELKTISANIHTVAEMLQTVSTKGMWESGSGCTFAGKVGKTPQLLFDVANRLSAAERIIRPYADRLEEYQRVMEHQRKRYDKFVEVSDERERKLATMTPEDPDYTRVDREQREAGNSREWAKRNYQREAEEALADEMAVAKRLTAIKAVKSDPGGYNAFEGASRIGTSSLVSNPVVAFTPWAKPLGALAAGDPLGKLGRRVVYGEGSYTGVAQSSANAALTFLGKRRGSGAATNATKRQNKRARELDGVRARYSSTSTNPMAVRRLGHGLKNKVRQTTATTTVRGKHKARDILEEKTGIRMIEDMTADWAAIAGAGRVKKGAHIITYTARGGKKAKKTVNSVRTAEEKIRTVTGSDTERRERRGHEREPTREASQQRRERQRQRPLPKDHPINDLVATPFDPPGR